MRWHCVGLCAMALLWPPRSFALEIVKDGRAVATVVTPDRADAVSTEAARLLKQYVKECTGADLAVVTESAAPAGAKIFVGPTKAAQAAGLDTAPLVGDSYFMRVKDGALYLIGRDFAVTNVRDPLGARGTMRAIFDFLRDQAGVRWIVPGPKGTWTPQRKNLSAPDDLNVAFVPNLLYETREIEPRFDSERLYPWGLANGARRAIQLYTAGGHTWNFAFPNLEDLRTMTDAKERAARIDAAIAEFAKTHPEVYALDVNGRRENQPSDYGGEHGLEVEYGPYLCTSHPDFVPWMTKWIQDKFDQGYELVQLGPSDAMPPSKLCHCERCNKEFGALSGQPRPRDLPKDATAEQIARAKAFQAQDVVAIANRILIPHIEVLQNCLKSHPNKLVLGALGYQGWPYIERKDCNIVFPPNLIFEGGPAPDMLDNLKRFAPEATAYGRWWGVTWYSYWWGCYSGGICPKHSPETIAEQQLKALKYKILGNYFCGGGENWPGEGPSYYAALRITEQPNLTPQELLKEYCTGLYGNAAPTMVQYYDSLYENLKVDRRTGSGGCDSYGSNVETRHRMKYLICWPREKLAALDSLLKKAESEAAGDERALNFIRLARIGYEQIYFTDIAFQEYDVYEKNPTPEGQKKVRAALSARQDWIKHVRALKQDAPEFVRDYFPNYDIFVTPDYIEDMEARFSPLGKPFSGWKEAAEGANPLEQ